MKTVTCAFYALYPFVSRNACVPTLDVVLFDERFPKRNGEAGMRAIHVRAICIHQGIDGICVNVGSKMSDNREFKIKLRKARFRKARGGAK